MYSVATMAEYSAVLLLLIVSWIAGGKASKLLFSGSVGRLRKRARGLLFWAGGVALLTCAIIGINAYMAASYDMLFWIDRIAVHDPLVGVPLLLLAVSAVPKLAKLQRATKEGGDGQAGPQLLAEASHPGIVVPFQMSALGALTTFYFAMVPPVPFRLPEVAIPVALYALLSALLWWLHTLRSRKAARHEAKFATRFWAVRVARNALVLAVCGAIAWPLFAAAMERSRLPAELDMMAGVADYGGGAVSAGGAHHHHAGHAAVQTAGAQGGAVSVDSLAGPRTGKPDRTFALTAEKKNVQLSSGKTVEAWTYNGQIPGPELRMKQGELVEVTLTNKNIEDGVTIHWHGLDVPNAEDGVAGATQNAVMPGETYTYRFVAEQVGTFWYHSHQNSKTAVEKGLFGALVVEQKQPEPNVKDITVMTHVWEDAGFAIGASDTIQRMAIAPGTPVRMRLINTDNWVRQTYTLVGAEFQVVAIDGTDLNEPGSLRDTHLTLTTGGRYDIAFRMPNGPVYLSVGHSGMKLGIFMSPDGQGEPPAIPSTVPFEPQRYGRPAPTPFDADSKFDREFTMVLDNKLGFYNGTFNSNYTINGAIFPNTPMYMVREGDLVKTTIVGRGQVDHPMHLHGHHMLVLSRNGEPVTGSPWWSDTLDVSPGETYVVAFRADNPGIWMDHCHNLAHAAVGMTMHLAYEGVTTPYKIGSATNNHPE
ncbi:multicopper oxidase family protein [Paenibacillus sp. GYB003]|uniref:multicopper oxidase family protein n=1 Tax=Paenibacillus sp. GYB003 TaxID=2994392 RepID=UPI002F960EE7